ncbi:MAG TPA: hypothetical protein VMB03_32535 [Bryobacteraceae bacterium]|nr:hypothetical protein [Bryobacteraceae bacterium]
MDLHKVLAQLREELENLDAAILSLERLQREGRPRGRPPKALSHLTRTVRTARKAPAGPDDPEAEEG